MQPLILLIVDSEWEQMIRPNNMYILQQVLSLNLALEWRIIKIRKNRNLLHIAIEIMTIFYNNFGYLFAKISVHIDLCLIYNVGLRQWDFNDCWTPAIGYKHYK